MTATLLLIYLFGVGFILLYDLRHGLFRNPVYILYYTVLAGLWPALVLAEVVKGLFSRVDGW